MADTRSHQRERISSGHSGIGGGGGGKNDDSIHRQRQNRRAPKGVTDCTNCACLPVQTASHCGELPVIVTIATATTTAAAEGAGATTTHQVSPSVSLSVCIALSHSRRRRSRVFFFSFSSPFFPSFLAFPLFCCLQCSAAASPHTPHTPDSSYIYLLLISFPPLHRHTLRLRQAGKLKLTLNLYWSRHSSSSLSSSVCYHDHHHHSVSATAAATAAAIVNRNVLGARDFSRSRLSVFSVFSMMMVSDRQVSSQVKCVCA